MPNYTQEGLNPSESTIDFIKKIAYTYRVMQLADGSKVTFCLN